MFVNKGEILNVEHGRKGNFIGIAIEDFDSETAEFYPIALAQEKTVHGASMGAYWAEGEEIPCRASLCKIAKV